jgi:hypothetical protein
MKTRLYRFVVDAFPSKGLYTNKKAAVEGAKKQWLKYSTKDLPHMKAVSYSEAVKNGLIWFESLPIIR